MSTGSWAVIGTAHSSGVSGTLIVAIIALAVSASSLTWQIAQHLLTGARVSVELNIGAHNGAGVIYGPVTKAYDWSGALQQGYREPVVVLVARNRGRVAAYITKWSFPFESKIAYQPLDDAAHLNRGKEVPYRLEPGAEVTWIAPTAPLQAAAAAYQETFHRPAGRVYGEVALGSTGRSIRSRDGVTVGE